MLIYTLSGYIFLQFLMLIPGAARAGLEAQPTATIVNSPVCARTGFPLSSGQFIKVTDVCHENVCHENAS